MKLTLAQLTDTFGTWVGGTVMNRRATCHIQSDNPAQGKQALEILAQMLRNHGVAVAIINLGILAREMDGWVGVFNGYHWYLNLVRAAFTPVGSELVSIDEAARIISEKRQQGGDPHLAVLFDLFDMDWGGTYTVDISNRFHACHRNYDLYTNCLYPWKVYAGPYDRTRVAEWDETLVELV